MLATTTEAQPANDQIKPWQKFAPSPSSASPTASILKRTESPAPVEMGDISEGTTVSSIIKRRRVKFSDPPVSEQVEIPRSQLTGGSGSGGACITGPNKTATSTFAPSSNYQSRVPQRQESSKSIPPLGSINNENGQNVSSICENEFNESLGLHEATPILETTELDEIIDASLIEKSLNEPISSILCHLTNKTFHKAAKRSLEENGILTVADLCKMKSAQLTGLKGLKPPNNITTVKEALRKFEKVLQKREIITNANNVLYNKPSTPSEHLTPKEALEDKITSKLANAPFMESTTPDEDDEALKEIYERPSPSPTELEQEAADKVALLQEGPLPELSPIKDSEETDKCGKDEREHANNIKDTIHDTLINEGVDGSTSILNPSGNKNQANVTPQQESSMNPMQTADISVPSTPTLAISNIEPLQKVDTNPVQLNAVIVESKKDDPENRPQMVNVGTQVTPATVNMINVETNTTEIYLEPKSCVAEVQAVVDTAAEGCQAVPDTSETQIQTNELTKEAKIQETYKLFKQLDAKTLAIVIGNGHAIMQEKLSQL